MIYNNYNTYQLVTLYNMMCNNHICFFVRKLAPIIYILGVNLKLNMKLDIVFSNLITK